MVVICFNILSANVFVLLTVLYVYLASIWVYNESWTSLLGILSVYSVNSPNSAFLSFIVK